MVEHITQNFGKSSTEITFSKDDFEFFKNFLLKESGYNLAEDKSYLLETRLQTVVKDFGLSGIQEIVQKTKLGQIEIINAVIEAMTVNETLFFRDSTPYKIFEKVIFPELLKHTEGRPIKIWSAACSTGQEPYSIAMILENKKESFPSLNYRIIATDINETVLNTARKGIFSDMEISRGLPSIYLNRFFEKAGSKWQISDRVKSHITFEKFNLNDRIFKYKNDFDFILLRNVLIYFDAELKRQIFLNMANAMKNHAYLLLGSAEAITQEGLPFKKDSVLNSLYTKV